MAIGLSLTPRGYNVDTTGKAYTLDPDPLTRASERNFALQRESQKGMYDAAKKGFDFIEYLGARQQLGRVKAQLGELNPNDPAFAQRYSDIILGNPLAFEHASTAPLAKMALAPVTAMAAGAIEQRYKLEQIAETGRQQLAAARLRGDTSTTNALFRALYGGGGNGGRPAADADLLGGEGNTGGTTTPEANIYAGVGTGVNNPATTTGAGTGGPNSDLFPLPTDTPPPFTPNGAAPAPGLLPPPQSREGEPTPRFAPEEGDATQTPTTGQFVPRAQFAPATLTPIGQEQEAQLYGNIAAPPRDGSLVAATPDVTDSPAAAAPPEVVAAGAMAPDKLALIPDKRGYRWIPTKIGANREYEIYLPATKPPQDPGSGRQWVVTENYANGAAKKWENLAEIKKSPEERALFNERRDVVLNADLDLLKLKAASTALTDRLTSLELEYKPYATDTRDKDNSEKRKELGPELNRVRTATSKAKFEYETAKALKTLKFAAREDPEMYEIIQRGLKAKAADDVREKVEKEEKEIGDRLIQEHFGLRSPETDVTASPAVASPPPSPTPQSISQQFASQEALTPERRALNETWTKEKVFALKEARDLATKLGLDPDSIINAVGEMNEQQAVKALEMAVERGISSPLVAKWARQVSRHGSITVPQWGKSSALGETYFNVLRAAVADPDAWRKAGMKGAGYGEGVTKQSSTGNTLKIGTPVTFKP